MILAAGNRAWGWASSATITPSSATVTVSHQLQFSISGQNSNKTWSVNGIAGGNATLGTITVSGLYTAPAAPPSPATVNITIGNASGSGAKVTIVPATGVTVSISPASAAVLVSNTVPFSAAVSGSANTTVSWSVNGIAGGNSTVGTISTTGLYTAPAAIPSSGAVTVTATSNADATQSAQATVTITSVSVLVSPSNVTLSTLQTQVFTASVSGSSNTGVNWSVNGIAGGNSTVGTISTGGFYTAPAAVPAGSIVVAATSQADPTKSSQASVTIIAGTLNITPLSTTVGTAQTVQFTVLQSSNQTSGQASQPKYTWSVNGVAGGNSAVGTITNKGIYTAPAVPPSPPTITITASTSTQNGTANALVVPIAVSVSPSTASVPVQKGQQFAAAVTGTTQTAVTWSVNGVAGGNSTVGTISANGMYTAPATAPSPATVAVAAQSVADPTKQSNASVNITGSSLTVTTSSLPNGWTGVAYTASLTASGGTAPYTWSISGGLLPAGVSLGTTTGLLSGTPSAAGAYNGQVTVTDALGGTATITLSFTIALSLSITTASVPGGTAGASYTYALASTGGTSPVSWTVASGQLPAGMTLSSSGTLSGTPAAAGSYTFVAQVADSSSPQETASQSYTLPVANPGSTSATITVLNADLPGGTIGVPYTATMSASGGTPPYTWSVASGSLPAGLTLDASTGVISGSPTAVGWSDMFTVQAQDSVGGTGSDSYSLTVTPKLDQFGGVANQSCTATGAFHPQKVGNRWWLCTPTGNLFWFNAVGCWGCLPSDGTDPGTGLANAINSISTLKYGDTSYTWGPQQNRRLKSWGFTGIGQMSAGSVLPWATDTHWPDDQTQPIKMPAILTSWSYYAVYNLNNYAPGPTKDLTWGQIKIPYRATMLDYFDENVWAWESTSIANNPTFQAQLKSPWTIGVLADDTDWMWGFGFGPDLPASGGLMSNLGWDVLVTSPVQTFNANPNGRGANLAQLYSDPVVYSKAGVAKTPPTVCDVMNPCSLRDSLKLQYQTIAALNTSWGSSYTSFDSTGVSVPGETIGIGDGQTKAFSYVLSHSPVSPLSIQVSVSGQTQAGDCPWWNGDCNIQASDMGTIMGPPGSGVLTGFQPWLSRIYGMAAAGYPDADYQAVIVWHYPAGSSKVSAASRRVAEHITSQQPFVTAPGPDPTGTATGYDVYMGCEMVSGAGQFGCSSAGVGSSLQLQASNIPVSSDWGAPVTGLVSGAAPPASPSTINYANGALQITFATPPANGATIAVNYTYHGWHSGGTGVMDEDGSSPWVGTNPYCLTPAPAGVTTYQCNGAAYPVANANPNLGHDVESWIAQFSANYHKRYAAILKSYNPNVAFMGADSEGTWGAPPRKEILQGAAPYVDILWPGVDMNQANTDFLARWFGDKPYLANVNVAASTDSFLFQYPGTGNAFDHPSQEDRGQWILDQHQNALSIQGASTSTFPWVGYVLWGEYDFWSERNSGGGWGLVSLNDNPYDGKASCGAAGVDPWGFATGGETVIPSWAPNHTYGSVPSKEDTVQVAVAGTIYAFHSTTGGISGGSAPAWPTTTGASVADGSVVWTNTGTKSSANCFGDVLDLVKQANSLWYMLP